MKNKRLSSKNIIIKKVLQNNLVSLNEIIEPGFNFGYITKKDNPKEYFVALVLYKIYSLNISLENVIFTNDVFMSIYLYRYFYELYAKVLYIFSQISEEEQILRLNEFYENKEWTFSDVIKSADAHLAKTHKERYKQICKFVHPNIDSLKLHYPGRTDDQQFEFLIPNAKLIIWFFVEIVKFFSNLKLLNLDKKLDLTKLVALQNV